jgi:hypothetical protein
MTDEALRCLAPARGRLYSATGRPSIPPEQLRRALLIQVLYSVRSERLLMEQLQYNLLFRWFVGLSMDDAVWHPTTFTKNRDRLLAGAIAARFFDAITTQARAAGLLSDEHFTVDGTPMPHTRRRATPRPCCSGRGTGKPPGCRTCGHVLLDNRHGLVANVCVTAATGTAERDAAPHAPQRRLTAGTSRRLCPARRTRGPRDQ